jgi:hypothetical protein
VPGSTATIPVSAGSLVVGLRQVSGFPALVWRVAIESCHGTGRKALLMQVGDAGSSLRAVTLRENSEDSGALWKKNAA